MRDAFINKLIEIATKDKDVILMTPDLGYSIFDGFREKFPGRFYNTGISEQNTIGMAAGMALCDKKVFVYSIIPFVTMRPFEHIRNDICYHNLPVKLIGSGAGFSYGALGPTHHAIEDITIMRALPNITIFSPADFYECLLCTDAAYRLNGPVYMRLEREKTKTNLYEELPHFQIGKGIVIKDGKDAMIIGTGGILHNVIGAIELLKNVGFECGLISMPTLKPIDKELIYRLGMSGKKIITVEEHSLVGGLGSCVAEVLTESQISSHLLKIGVPNEFCKEIGSQEYLRKFYGLDSEGIAKKIKKFLEAY